MKNRIFLCAVLFWVSWSHAQTPLTNTFTYQGELKFNNAPANDSYDFEFSVFDMETGGTVLDTVTVSGVTVTNGVFTTPITLNNDLFTGNKIWLEIGVRAVGTSDPFDLLSPRQEVTSSPYAIHAQFVGADAVTGVQIENGSITASDVDLSSIQKRVGGICAAGQYIRTINATGSVICGDDQDTIAPPAWEIGGNAASAGDFIGTTNAEPFTVKVNNKRIFNLENNIDFLGFHAPNILGGSENNSIPTGVFGSFIAGGGGDAGLNFCGSLNNQSCTNRIETNFSSVLGGQGNIINGGSQDATGDNSTIIGGFRNNVNGSISVISGGDRNSISTDLSFIGGGKFNIISGINNFSNIVGGEENNISSSYSVIGGGMSNQASGYTSAILGGSNNQASNNFSTVGGGSGNKASGYISTVIGGDGNQASADYTFVGGGVRNHASGGTSTVAGGSANQAIGVYSTIPGGRSNQAGGPYSFAAGNYAIVRDATMAGTPNGDIGTFVWSDSTATSTSKFTSTGPNQFLIRATGGVGIGTNNPNGFQLNVLGPTYLRNNADTSTSADLVLGGRTGNATDDGVLSSDLTLGGSDLFIKSNDAVLVTIDANDDGDAGRFEVRSTSGGTLLEVQEAGTVNIPGSLNVTGSISMGSFVVSDNTITSAKIVDGTIDSVDIKNDAITNAKIGVDAVDTNEIKFNAVRLLDINGVERLVYQVNSWCGFNNGLSTSPQCTSRSCSETVVAGTTIIREYFDCSGSCGLPSPAICNNSSYGYVLSPTIQN